jgi:hypothetical protein
MKKESKEMNSKVKVPRLQETKSICDPKVQIKPRWNSTWNPSREMKNHGKIRKQEIQNWTSNLFDFNTLKVTKKTPQRSTDFKPWKRNF